MEIRCPKIEVLYSENSFPESHARKGTPIHVAACKKTFLQSALGSIGRAGSGKCVTYSVSMSQGFPVDAWVSMAELRVTEREKMCAKSQ